MARARRPAQTRSVQRIGPYTIVSELARGGHGVVYRARDPHGAEVALKVLLARRLTSAAARKRFELEVEVLAQLNHPHVVRILGAGEHEGNPWLALELVDGQSLDQRLRAGALPVQAAVQVGVQLADALAHVHDQGVLHRDLKPSNVLLRGDQALLTDFGLALHDTDGTRLTAQGMFLGTPGYWPPEQAQGDVASFSPATDVYGLGAVLYACLTGRPPVEAESFPEYLRTLTFQQIESPRRLRPEVPDWLSLLVMRCLSFGAPARPQSAGEVARALREARYDPRTPAAAAEARPSAAPSPAPQAARRPLPVGVAVGLGLALTGALVSLGYALSVQGSPPPASLAELDTTPPLLTVETPRPGATLLGDGRLRIEGTASDPSGPVTLSVGTSRVTASPDGAFSLELELETGEHELWVVAHDAAANSTRHALKVRYTRAPDWFRELPEGQRATLPLASGLRFGDEPGDYVNELDGTVLRWIPAGDFVMGDPEGDGDEYQREWSFAHGFFMGKYETTWEQYLEFAAVTGRWRPGREIDMETRRGPKFVAELDHPAHSVIWEDAFEYCQWAGLRLPTEPEWEYAARGPDSRRYPWGDEDPTTPVLNIADAGITWGTSEKPEVKAPWDDGAPYTAPVGSFPGDVSVFGCYDMGGNVREWTVDRYRKRYRAPDPEDLVLVRPLSGRRSVRGSCWASILRTARSAGRGGYNVGWRNTHTGFRPARSRD